MLIATASGKLIDISSLTEKDITLDDISHHLTKICRFGGALPFGVHYSVASHSLNLCYYAMDNGYSKLVQQWALMHDATEAYLGDLVTGLKVLLPEYIELENSVEELILLKYNLKITEPVRNIVKEFDTRIVLDEAYNLIPYKFDLYKNQLPNHTHLGLNIVRDGNLALIQRAFLYTCETLDIKE